MTTNKAKTVKLTTLEKRAKEFCESLILHDPGIVIGRVAVRWSKSYTGCHARIENHSGEKVAFAGGGGYCKESAVLSDLLRWLFPIGSDEHVAIQRTNGAGPDSVRNCLASFGWKLERVYSDSQVDAYSITRIKTNPA